MLEENSKTEEEKIHRLVADIEDVTEPSSLDKLLEYAEQIRQEDDEFMQLLTEKLRYADVYWEQPWYQQEKALTITHKAVNHAEDETFRTDTMSKDEHDVIARNWRKLRKKYRLPDNIITLARWRNRSHSRNPRISAVEQARRFATAYLARGLKRNAYQVHRHILAYYGGRRKGFYNETEQKVMEICFHHKPRLAVVISAMVLGREPRGIYKRFHYTTHGQPERKRLKWNLTLATKFLQNLLTYTELSLDDLKNRKIEKPIWERLADDMDHNDSYLQHFWYCYLHVQLFVKCDVKLQELRKTLFNKLRLKRRDNIYKIWSDIRWKDVASEFPDGYTPRFFYRVCTRFIASFKGYLRAPIEDVIEYAFQKINKERKLTRNKRLKTLKFNKHGQLEVTFYRKRDIDALGPL